MREKLTFLFICVIFGVILYVAADRYLEKKIEAECKDCNASYSWCKDYWKEKGRCGK